MNLSKNKLSQPKSKVATSEPAPTVANLGEKSKLKDITLNESSPRLESFRMASQNLEDAIKGWAVVSQQCEEAKVEHRQVKKEIENLLKELQDKIKELS